MTIQTLFDRMMVLDNQLDLISGGDDVTRGIVTINLVQDWWEAAAATVEGACQTIADTILTVANQEHTVWPSNLSRIDELYLLDSSGRQVRQINLMTETGGHRPDYPWPLGTLVGTYGTGAPVEYWAKTKGGYLFWSPTPDAVYTIRGYGLWRVSDYSAAANTFGYVDDVALVLVPHAVQLFRTGLDRDTSVQQAQAEAAFRTVIKGMTKGIKSGPDSRVYGEFHDT